MLFCFMYTVPSCYTERLGHFMLPLLITPFQGPEGMRVSVCTLTRIKERDSNHMSEFASCVLTGLRLRKGVRCILGWQGTVSLRFAQV